MALTFAEMVKEARKAKNLSQSELADAAGVGASQVSRIENGHRGTDVDTLNALVRALGLDAGVALAAAAEAA